MSRKADNVLPAILISLQARQKMADGLVSAVKQESMITSVARKVLGYKHFHITPDKPNAELAGTLGTYQQLSGTWGRSLVVMQRGVIATAFSILILTPASNHRDHC